MAFEKGLTDKLRNILSCARLFNILFKKNKKICTYTFGTLHPRCANSNYLEY